MKCMVSGSSRRGQSAASAAILVAIIGGMLIAYILFLPPLERERLLFGTDGPQGGAGGGGSQYGGGGVFTQYGAVLVMSETPGTLRLLKSNVKEHPIPTATIFTSVNTEEISYTDSAIVKNGVFAKDDLEISFMADPRRSNNYLLSFNVDQAGAAPLTISLNGRHVYERPIRERTPAPIVLPVEYLNQGENTLEIKTSDSGIAFWRPNTYVLHNVLISGDIVDSTGAVSEQTFSLQQSELDEMEEARLSFVPECNPDNAGRLLVQLNSRWVSDPVRNETIQVPNVLYNGFVDCGVMFRSDVPKEFLKTGENKVLFASQGGQYVVDRISMDVKLKQQDYPVYYFNLPRQMYDVLDAGTNQLRMTMTFTDYRNVKSGEIVINGFVQSFSTPDYVYQAAIDPGILTPGPNTVQVIPHIDRLDIAELKIELI